jgi:hypothetical protein
LTLPDDVLAALTSVDGDVGRAVVRLSQPLIGETAVRPPAELSKCGAAAVIVANPVAALERMSGVVLLRLPDGRALISLDPTMSVAEFELKVRDAMDEGIQLGVRERGVLASIAEILRTARQTKGISVHQRSLIVLQSTGSGAARPSRNAEQRAGKPDRKRRRSRRSVVA